MSHSLLEPQLHPVALADLRPTQMTVGFAEVANKRALWRTHVKTDGPDFLGRHMIPVVIGPKQVPWLIDHHHLACALLEEGVAQVLVSIVARLSQLSRHTFFTYMDNRNWLHPFNAKGERCAYSDLPKRLSKLTDDPYRSLAGEVRKLGGYAKTDTPYSEFLWADFFRHRVDAKLVKADLGKAARKAIKLAHSEQASYLPGFCGAS
jgi:hypothetical protein